MAAEFTSTWSGLAADNYLDSANPATNNSTSAILLIGWNNSSRAAYHTLFDLDLLGVSPTTGPRPGAADQIAVVSATLDLQVIIAAPVSGQAAHVGLLVEDQLNMAQSTWNAPYTAASHTWQGGVLSELTEPTSSFEMQTATGAVSIDITELVQQAVETEDAHLRLIVRHDEEPSFTNRTYYASAEHPSVTPPGITLDWDLDVNAADVARGPLVNAPILRQRLIGGRLV